MRKNLNLLLILSDDQGYGDLSFHGNPHLKTPAMDSIGEQGDRLERFYVSPVSTPTRASLLTGRYHLRTEVFGVSNRQEVMSPEDTSIVRAVSEKWVQDRLYWQMAQWSTLSRNA